MVSQVAIGKLLCQKFTNPIVNFLISVELSRLEDWCVFCCTVNNCLTTLFRINRRGHLCHYCLLQPPSDTKFSLIVALRVCVNSHSGCELSFSIPDNLLHFLFWDKICKKWIWTHLLSIIFSCNGSLHLSISCTNSVQEKCSGTVQEMSIVTLREESRKFPWQPDTFSG